jgi:hypothetical protein
MKIIMPIEITLKPKKLTERDARRLIKTEKVVHRAVKKFGVPETDEEIEKMAEYIYEGLKREKENDLK